MAVGERLAELAAVADAVIGTEAASWDAAGAVPAAAVRELSAGGVLCAQVDIIHDGPGLSSVDNGLLTALVGSRCASTRSLMTSQGMAAWAVQRLGTRAQRARLLPTLVSGSTAAVAFSEEAAGSDLSAMGTLVESGADGTVVVTGRKRWITGATHADVLVVFGRHADGAAAVVVPTDAPGVRVDPVTDALGCRAAGHAEVVLSGVRLPGEAVLGGPGLSVALLVTSALTYGRLSVAWGCVGMLRACLGEVTRHAAARRQFGKPLAHHQLVARHIADLHAAERTATAMCERASRHWDDRSPELISAAVLAKYVAAGNAAAGAASAVQVLASAGAHDHGFVARAYRDAKLMEVIEGSTEICQLLLADHVMSTSD